MQQPVQSPDTENADPHEQYNPVPRVVLGLVFGLVVWAVTYIVVARPDGMAGLGDRRSPEALVGAGTPSTGAVDGRQLFVARCQACHQASGQGLPGVFPPLAQSPWVKGAAEVPVQIVLHGLTGPIEVGNVTYNGAMPGFGAQLNDAEAAAVLSFVRAEWGNASSPVTGDVVAAGRKASADRSGPWSSIQELQGFLARPGSPS
jgi:mono/diheme cytochrome c family protein